MIPKDVIESTANELMAKAAIEIPDDYLTGLKKAADSEDGDLSSFVLHAMLENYDAAKEDGRAMCGDTGTPRWYVKMGNEARIEGGPVALEAALQNASRFARSQIALGCRKHPEGGVIFTVRDDGPGIGTQEKKPSTGLGVDLCNAIATAHNKETRHGEARLSNHPDGGALFELCLP